MTDIVERIRQQRHEARPEDIQLLLEAADEIERLRKDVQNLNRDCMMLAGERR